jgi:hypothetical protein
MDVTVRQKVKGGDLTGSLPGHAVLPQGRSPAL